MSHGPAHPTAPRDERLKQAWRVACVTYRQCKREGHLDSICFHNARHRLWMLVRELGYWGAANEITQAIAFASWAHPEWLWDGTSGVSPRSKFPYIPPHIINDPVSLRKTRQEEKL
jgi:hypothetical protein